MADNILDIQFKLLSSEKDRKEFAANPKAFLKARGIDLPADMQVPDSLDLDVLDTKLEIAQKRLQDRGVRIAEGGKVEMKRPEFAGRTLSDVFAPETSDLESVRKRIQDFRARGPNGDEQTVAVMAAVVEVVVAP